MSHDVNRDAQSEAIELLAELRKARKKSGLSMDFWVDLIDGLDHKSALILCGKSAMFPKYINSKGKL